MTENHTSSDYYSTRWSPVIVTPLYLYVCIVSSHIELGMRAAPSYEEMKMGDF